jgi:hypothetical protein
MARAPDFRPENRNFSASNLAMPYRPPEKVLLVILATVRNRSSPA